jgi:hypothetical protein
MTLTKILTSLVLWLTTMQLPMLTLDEPQTQTSLSRTDLACVLRQAHVQAYGVEPSKQRLAMAWSQVAVECGQGKLVYNRNLGNIGASLNDQPFYWVNGHKYRSFDSFNAGARAYWATVTKCGPAMQMFDAGSPAGAAEYLRKCGYYGAELEPYSEAMSQLYWLAIDSIIPEEAHEQRNECSVD